MITTAETKELRQIAQFNKVWTGTETSVNAAKKNLKDDRVI